LGSPKTDAYGQALGGAVQVQVKPRPLKKSIDHDEVMGSVGKWKFGMANFLIFSPKRTRLTSGKAEASEMIYDPQRSQGANKYVKYDS